MKGDSGVKISKKRIYGYLLPGLIIYVGMTIIPVIIGFAFSLYKGSSLVNAKFVGLENYVNLVKDMEFWLAFKNNMIIAVLSVIGEVGLGFIISIVLTAKAVKLREFHRMVVFLPVILAPVIVGFIWSLIYDKNFGLLDQFLRMLGLEAWIRPWLDDPKCVMYSLTIPLIWQWMGYYVVILMSAFQSISTDIFEASEIDGAGTFKKTVYITFPLLKDTLLICIMICIAGVMKIFDHIFVMTGGGPGTSSQVLAMYAYKKSFIQFDLGYGSAVSMGIIVLSYLLIVVVRMLFGIRKKEQ